MTSTTSYEAVIGLEVHVQLATETKLFCSCRHDFGAEPNQNVCPVCLGQPGALPVLNREALRLAVRAAAAFGCDVASFTKFDRKNYFYPDLPKGYQISQGDLPYATGGQVEFDRADGSTGTVQLERIHIEEDAGKLIHEETRSLVDLNRCGTPLLEIVSKPELRTPADAQLYARAIRELVRWIGVSDANMEQGSLRCDVNVSLREEGTTELGTRTEIKNLNSFASIEAALEFEMARQAALLEAGGVVAQETRLFEAETGATETMREKEDSHDYRYFAESDLPTVTIPAEWTEAERVALPELPRARRARYRKDLGLSATDAGIVTSSREYADYFDALLGAGMLPKDASNWFQTEILREINDRKLRITEFPLQPDQIAAIVRAVTEQRISVATGREVFREAAAGAGTPEELLASRGEQISDTTQLDEWIEAVLAENPDTVATIQDGNDKAIAFLMGQVMKLSSGQANPRVVAKMIEERLRGD